MSYGLYIQVAIVAYDVRGGVRRQAHPLRASRQLRTKTPTASHGAEAYGVSEHIDMAYDWPIVISKAEIGTAVRARVVRCDGNEG